MANELIWVVVYAKPPKSQLAPLFDERARAGAEVMRPRRFKQAQQMAIRDRIVVHFGGPWGSDPRIQHLVLAGCVKEAARPLTLQDAEHYPRLIALTAEGFPGFPRDLTDRESVERQGIIFYEWHAPPPTVGYLPIPYAPPMPSNNFIPLRPGQPAYHQVRDWWRQVVPKGKCGNR